ncbi:hypothetical protein KJ359_009323 [Pestalotiopsis sp. 9143b]|nr:hypothetical protein KJ359_009323 [Pestalotiopsis sp. 9143b]
MVPFVNTVNVQGADIGLGATKGTKFLWMTWSATILMLITGCIWLLDYFVERRFLYGYGTQTYGNTRMMDYRAREKELKAERKIFKKERAMEHEAYKSARLAQRGHGTRGYLQPLPGELVRHAAIQQLEGGYGPSNYYSNVGPDYRRSPGHYPREFI